MPPTCTGGPMSRTPRRVPFALAVASAVVLAACGGGDSGSGLSTVSKDTLTVCSDTPYEPFEFKVADKDTGYDMDLLRAIAENDKLDFTVKDLPFDGILGSMAAGDCDVVASAVPLNPQAAQQGAFGDAHFAAAPARPRQPDPARPPPA